MGDEWHHGAGIWRTNPVRRHKPSPEDEARYGLSVVEVRGRERGRQREAGERERGRERAESEKGGCILHPEPCPHPRTQETLWHALPDHYHTVDNALKGIGQSPLPVDCCLLTMGSWMGGDRDGNPYVTSKLTKRVVYLSQWRAAHLYWQEVMGYRSYCF